MSASRKIAKNTLFQLASKATTTIFGLVTRKLLTRYLGPSGFGDYVFSLNYANLFASLADWGTQLVSIREASKFPQERSAIFGTSFLLRTAASLVAAFIALLLLRYQQLSPTLTFSASLACILIVLFALKASLGQIYDTLLRHDRWYYVELITAVVSLSLFSVTIYFGFSLPYFILSLVVSTLLAMLTAYLLSRSLVHINFTYNPLLIKRIISQSLPMGGVLILFSLYNRIDTVLLQHLTDSTQVGLYGLAYFLYDNLVVMAAFVMTSALPLLSPQVTTSGPTDLFNTYFQKLYDLMLMLGLLVMLGTLLASPVVIFLVSTPEFTGSIPLLRILGMAAFFSYLNHVTGFSLIALGKQATYFYINLLALALNLAVNIITIPLFGATASAWATVATEALVQLLSFILISRSLGRFPSLFSFPKTTYTFLSTRGRIF